LEGAKLRGSEFTGKGRHGDHLAWEEEAWQKDVHDWGGEKKSGLGRELLQKSAGRRKQSGGRWKRERKRRKVRSCVLQKEPRGCLEGVFSGGGGEGLRRGKTKEGAGGTIPELGIVTDKHQKEENAPGVVPETVGKSRVDGKGGQKDCCGARGGGGPKG